jgi:hypothetical protein
VSGTASVPNTFASAVTATGAQLDANYSTIVAYINDPTNRNNYAADGAATNTVALTFSPPVVGGYTTGLELTWKWGQTNSGAVVLNANGLGNVAVVNPDGTALAAGQGTAGSIGKAVYDGTRFIFLASSATPASAAQVSAAATLVPFVSPGRMQNHPGVAKAWASFLGTATGTVTSASWWNVASVRRTGVGTYSVAFSTAFANTAYAVVGNLDASAVLSTVGGTRAAGGVMITTYSSSDAAVVDSGGLVNFVVYGAQ